MDTGFPSKGLVHHSIENNLLGTFQKPLLATATFREGKPRLKIEIQTPSPGILFHAVDHLPSELPREEGKKNARMFPEGC